MAEHEELVLAIGPYLLGALDGETRRRLREHLESCEACQAELIRLAGVPGLMAQVGPPNLRERAEADPSPNLRDRLVTEVVAERAGRRRRQQVLSAAAALLLVALPVGAFVGARSFDGPALEIPVSDEVALTTANAQLTGTVSWSAHGWGAELYPEMRGLEPGAEYELIAYSIDGNEDVVMTWAGAEGLVNPIGTMSITEDNLSRLVVRRTDAPQEALLWLDAAPAPSPSASPAATPTGEPVAAAPSASASITAAAVGGTAGGGTAGGVGDTAGAGGAPGTASSSTGPTEVASGGVPPVGAPLPSLPPGPLPSVPPGPLPSVPSVPLPSPSELPGVLPSPSVTVPGIPPPPLP